MPPRVESQLAQLGRTKKTKPPERASDELKIPWDPVNVWMHDCL